MISRKTYEIFDVGDVRTKFLYKAGGLSKKGTGCKLHHLILRMDSDANDGGSGY